MNLAVIVLAAGKGTRMESDLAKVLHPLRGRPLIHWVLDAATPLQSSRTVLVVGHQGERVYEVVRSAFAQAEFVTQPEMLGTGHAVMQTEPLLRDFDGDIIVICGDTPLIETATLQKLVETRRQNQSAAAMLVCELNEPGAYGRVLMNADGSVQRIVEAKDATLDELSVQTVNAGTYCFESAQLWATLAKVNSENAAGEYYLTDVVGLLTGKGKRVDAVAVSEREMTGINTRAQLQELESALEHEGAGTGQA